MDIYNTIAAWTGWPFLFISIVIISGIGVWLLQNRIEGLKEHIELLKQNIEDSKSLQPDEVVKRIVTRYKFLTEEIERLSINKEVNENEISRLEKELLQINEESNQYKDNLIRIQRKLEGLQRSAMELSFAFDVTLEGWSRAFEKRDKEDNGRSIRVTEMTLRFAKKLGIPDDDLINIRRGALLHDIGKMGIPNEILSKSDKLSDSELEIYKRHPKYAYELMMVIPLLRPSIDIPYCSNENWDGSGFPRGLKGEDIPLTARIFTLINSWDEYYIQNCNKEGWTREMEINYLRSQSGKCFDPNLVEKFISYLNEIEDQK